MHTDFLSAERASTEAIRRRAKAVGSLPNVRLMLDAVPGVALILEEHRQILLANRAALEELGKDDEKDLLGLRPGEAFGCVHAGKSDGGCGTTVFCRYCGAGNAVAEGLGGCRSVWEVGLTTDGGKKTAHDFRAWAVPLELDDRPLMLLVLHGTEDEKRRRVLERIFFHDVLNTATALKGLTQLAKEGVYQDYEEVCSRVAALSRRIVEEIEAQRTLLSAEDGELTPSFETVDAHSFLADVCAGCGTPEILNGRCLELETDGRADFRTDRALCGRVVVNLLRNALEASMPGQTVTVGYAARTEGVEIRVRNETYMPEDIQRRIFSRSFSTKGPGRGLGTYSVKLLTERYLGGRVWFESTPGAGTTFYVFLPPADG